MADKDNLTFDSSTKNKKGPQNLKELMGFGKRAVDKKATPKVAVPASKPSQKKVPVPADKPAPKHLPMADSRPKMSPNTPDRTKDDYAGRASKGRQGEKITPVTLSEVWTPKDFSGKVKAAKERKTGAMNRMASKVGIDSMGKKNELPAPASKAIVDQYGLGKKIK